MATVLLIRHGQTPANASGILAGTSPGIQLDDTGIQQISDLSKALKGLVPQAIITSPMERTVQTADIIAQGLSTSEFDPQIQHEPGLIECDYGSWTGRSLAELAHHEMWRAVQDHPSSVVFPGESGESMQHMQNRAVASIRRWNDLLGPDSLYIAVSHGDVIKSVIADALGMHLDHFQRIVIDPGSVSVVRYATLRPFVVATNASGEKASRFVTAASDQGSDAPVGGGSS
jgi:probable phosphomutase (TIGR03848 family)